MAKRRVRIGKKGKAWVKWAVMAGVVLLLGVTFAASVGVGTWLLRTAEKYPAEKEQQTVPEVPKEEIVPITVPRIKAHAYHVGDRYTSYLNAGIAQLCAPLRTADGALVFDSAVCERAGWEPNGSADLAANVENLHHNNLYLTAYLPISGFAEQDAAMQELTLSYEAALIAEAAAAGVDEVFLCGLAPTQANIARVCEYVRRVKVLAGDCAIGVLITPEVLLSARYEAYTAAQLLTVCDYLVLDLRGIPLDAFEPEAEQQTLTVRYIMESMQYDLIRYSPRLALDGTQTDALDYVISKGYQNWVIMESAEQTDSEGS
ncbi:MAG: hypothetical protein J6S28_10445 [Clostridia bacterium]|nr:hypothetical protein [Clostridia bacterium]